MRKSRFFALLCAFIPGAGEMYLGLLKRGASIMLLFCFNVLCSIVIPPLMIFLPVIFFYSFFDTLTLRNHSGEERQELVARDDHIFSEFVVKDGMEKIRAILARSHLFIGWVLLGCGLYVIYERFSYILWRYIDLHAEEWYWLARLLDSVPSVVVALILIWLGLRFIRGKKIKVDAGEEDFSPYGGSAGSEKEAE